MRIDPKAAIWVVTDPGPDSTLVDVCFRTTLDGLRLLLGVGISTRDSLLVIATEEAARKAA